MVMSQVQTPFYCIKTLKAIPNTERIRGAKTIFTEWQFQKEAL